MFTGLVETTAELMESKKLESGVEFWFRANLPENDLKIGDSVSTNGACLTVVALREDLSQFQFYASFKTLELTNLGLLQVGSIVNVERSLLPTTRLGGHFVSGHVDGLGTIESVEERENGSVIVYWIHYPYSMERYTIERGSIAVDGISLTITAKKEGAFQLILIPETLKKTNAKTWKVGSTVNIELDQMAKYLENFIRTDHLPSIRKT